MAKDKTAIKVMVVFFIYPKSRHRTSLLALLCTVRSRLAWGLFLTRRAANMENVLKKGCFWRSEEAKEVRRVRKLLRGQDQEEARVCKTKVFGWVAALGISLLMLAALFIAGCFISTPAHAKDYTDEEIVNAIYKAEGGSKAKKPYGILSVSCSSKEDCRRVCLRTVRNNRIRHKRDVKRNGEDYLSYLSRKYAPIGVGNDPQGLNRNWLKNVKYFLAKEVR